MPYKDKDKQREAVKEATRRYRLKVSPKVSPTIKSVIPVAVKSVIPTQPIKPGKPAGMSDNQWAYIQFKAEQAQG